MFKHKENSLIWMNREEFYNDEELVMQVDNVSTHPWIVGNFILTPDGHLGYGMPIGGVVALKNAVCPNMVGVDIGCGMLAVKTSLIEITTEQLKIILGGSKKYNGGIRANIPVGFNKHSKDQECDLFNDDRWYGADICGRELSNAKKQLGTLGGGNHFIEIQKGSDNHIWFMIHSGSRNLGYQVAKHYNKVAEDLCKLWKQDSIVNNELAILPFGIDEYDRYLQEMQLCLDFAYENRKHMSNAIKSEFKKVFDNIEFKEEINIHHNYASIESHYSQNVIVHRKGATLARENTIGIIPGSQGTSSYIVQGLGNKASLTSCSHGAGRKMSRTKAIANLDLTSEQKLLDDKGILHSIRHKNSLDEAPSAYKDIDVVMEEQKDLVKILVKLQPLDVVKG